MICPQCATRNELGSQRCRACHRPFTHAAYQANTPARRFRPGRTPARGHVPSDRREGYRAGPVVPVVADTSAWSGQAVAAVRSRRRRRPHGCLIAVGLLSISIAALLVAGLLASSYIVKPMVRDAAVADLRSGVRDEVSARIATRIVDAPEGELVITDDEINQRLASSGDLGPIDNVVITITPEMITVDLRAYGLSGTYQSVVRAENGSVVLDGGTLNGPLAYVIPNDELANAANAEIAAALSAAGYRVESATMRDGAIALTVVR